MATSRIISLLLRRTVLFSSSIHSSPHRSRTYTTAAKTTKTTPTSTTSTATATRTAAMSQAPNRKPVHFGIALFPAFQALDVFGPLDALNILSRMHHMKLYTIAETLDPVSTKLLLDPQPMDSDFGQLVLPTHTFATAPPLDVLMVPGGQGTRAPPRGVVEFIQARFPELQYLITVCTGSGLAARAGVLDGRRATTNKLSWESTIALRPQVNWVHRARWVVDGNVWTSSGISAGIDVTFAWIAAVHGEETARTIANRMEYTRVTDPDDDPFAREGTKI